MAMQLVFTIMQKAFQMSANNNEIIYSAPQNLTTFFSKQHKVSIQIFLVGLVILTFAVSYELLRINDLGFDTLRTLVYVTVLPFMLLSFIYIPIKNYSISKKTASSIIINTEDNATVITLTGNKVHLVNFSIRTDAIRFYGDEYKMKIIQQGSRQFLLPLNKV